MSDREKTVSGAAPLYSAFIADILSQPERLAALDAAAAARAARPLVGDIGRYRRIVLTGMGASFAALRPLWLSLVGKGHSAWLVEASEFMASCLPLVDGSTLVVIVSQSGRSAEIVVAVEAVAERGGRILAVTNDASSALADGADAVVEIAAGAEAAVSTKTYTNTLGALLAVEWAALGHPPGDDLARACEAMDRYLATWRQRVDAIKFAIGAPERLFYLARGSSLASADYGALIAKEAAKWPVEAESAAQFRHGPLELADPRLTTVLLSGDAGRERDLTAALERDLRRYGARVFRLGSDAGDGPLWIPEAASSVRPIVEAPPLQLLAVALAEAGGIEPGVFRHLGKVTTEL
ncbi:MAG TPA: SIS domain-containing protein [Methylomirabilota bacterium]|nr:SIS domain-containing protein [Methylomirabilota bacterium]